MQSLRLPIRTMVVVHAVVLCAIAASAQQQLRVQQRWTEFRSPEHGFAAVFPGTPEVKTQHNAAVASYIYEVDASDQSTFSVLVLEYASDSGTRLSDNDLNQLIDAYTKDGTRILRRSATRIDGHNAIEAVLDIVPLSDSVGLVDIMNYGNRVYLMLCVGPKAIEPSADLLRFRDSFHLLGK